MPPTLPRSFLRDPLAVAADLRRQLDRLARRSLSAQEFMFRARRLVARAQPLLARSLRESILRAYLTTAAKTARAAGVQTPAPGLFPPGPPLPPVLIGAAADDSTRGIRFPAIEAAARSLANKRLLTIDDFRALDQDARRVAWTVARVQSVETIQRVHTALLDDIRHGGTLRGFREKLAEDLDGVLALNHVETLYRTQLGQVAAAGQRAVLDHPLVSDEFPYLLWTAVHDSRVRPDHLKMEKWGPGGCAVYRRDDPMWDTLWPPASYNCRCWPIPLSVEDAARHGSAEARAWLRTGRPPVERAWAARPYPIIPPPGWPTGGRVGAVV